MVTESGIYAGDIAKSITLDSPALSKKLLGWKILGLQRCSYPTCSAVYILLAIYSLISFQDL